MASSSSSPEYPPPASPESPPPHLRALVTSLMESNYFATVPHFIHRFIQTPNNEKRFKKEILDYLCFNEPSSFSLKLAEILSLDPPFHIRNEAVLLLQETLAKTPTNEYLTIRHDTILELKNLILESFKIEIQEPLLPPLTSAIADLAFRIYDFALGGWVELLVYIFSCVTMNSYYDDSVLKQRKGLMLLAELPDGISEHLEFWNNHYNDLYQNLMDRILDETADENSQTLVFDSLYTMLVIALPLEEYLIGGSILLLLVDHIDQHSDEEILLKRFLNLANFVSQDVDQVLKGNEEYVFMAMLRIAERNGTNKGLRCATVKVLKGLLEDRFCNMEFSDVDAQRFIKVSLEMMFESDTQCFELGKSMLNWLSFKDEESYLFPMLTNFLKSTYSASKYLKKRHAVMAIVARFADTIISDGSVFATEIIKMISDEINHISTIIERGRAQEAGTSEGGSEYLPDDEIIQSSKILISATVKAFKHRLSPCAEELFSTIAQIWGNDFPDRVKAIAFFFMNMIGPHFPDKLQIYHDRYTNELLKATEGSLHAQETARGIAICAMHGGQKFKTIVNEAISKLYSLIEHGQSIKGEEHRYGANISNMAVAALGMICEVHPENVDGRSEVIRRWLSFFPLTDNLNIAKYVHGQLSKMLKRKDADVLGPNKENLPKIISILKAIFSRHDELATEETCSEITVFLGQHGVDLE